jgi:hypothetical protein
MEQALCLTDTDHPFPLLPETRSPFPIRQNITPIHMPLTIVRLTCPPSYITSLLQYIAPPFTLRIMLYMRASHVHRKSPCFDLHSLSGHVREVSFGEVVIVGGPGTVVIRLDSVPRSDKGMGHCCAGEYCREVSRWWAKGFMNGELVESISGFAFAEGVEEWTKCHNGVVRAARTGW